MLGLGTSTTSIDHANIYKEASEFGSQVAIWFDFSRSLVGGHGAEVIEVQNLGSAGDAYDITSNVHEPTVDDVTMGKPSVEFQGTSNEAIVLDRVYSTTGKPYTWFIVLYRPDDGPDAIIASAADGAEYFQLRGSGASIKVAKADMSADKIITLSGTGGGTVDYTYQDASDAGSNGIQVIVYNRTSSGAVNIYNHFGDYIALSTNAVVKSAADMSLGALGGTSSGSITDFTGNIGEFGLFDGDIGTTKSSELAKNLAIKWGAATV